MVQEKLVEMPPSCFHTINLTDWSHMTMQVMRSLLDGPKPPGSALITGGHGGHISAPCPRHSSLMLLSIGEETGECGYVTANALRPCEVSAGRWCVAHRSRTNGQMRGEVWRNTPITSTPEEPRNSNRGWTRKIQTKYDWNSFQLHP